MSKITKEEKILNEKLKALKLDLDNIPKKFQIEEKVSYRPVKEYDNTNYKIYHYIDIKDIEIYLTPTTRLEETSKKYKLAEPLVNYLQPENEELKEKYDEFIEMVKELNIEKIEEIEKEQKQFQENVPFQVKYKENYLWSIYYSEVEQKYFMMFPKMETQTETLFYLIKKQIELQKSRKKEMIYVPINNMEYTSGILRKSEIVDLENYLWYFTKDWPTVYEVQNKDKTKTMQVVGNVNIYDKIKSLYKMEFNTKEEASNYYKLVKAMFILKSNAEEEYSFKTGIDENANLCFYYNHNQLIYEKLADFIKSEIENKKKKIIDVANENLVSTEKWELLKETIANQNLEFLAKEKQIIMFLECKKSFFGKLSYFFKTKKKKKFEPVHKEKKQDEEIKEEIEKEEFKEKEFYTIEDLLKVCSKLQIKEKELKNKQLDIKALENKKENLELKIRNATIYINEIESHKKSIFDFWKFTNKDQKPLLTEAEDKEQAGSKEKLKKVFCYEDDIEQVGKQIDIRQREIFTEKETDSIFAIYNDTETFSIDRKAKKLKKDDKAIEKTLKQKQQEYEEFYKNLNEEADIFGNSVDSKSNVKVLNNKKHREIAKDEYKILDIHPETTLESYKDNIHHYEKILEDAYSKMQTPYDMKIYKADINEIKSNGWIIMNMNAKEEIKKCYEKDDENLILNCINIKENTQAIFYSNIIFYDNLNKTLPEGMDISQSVLIDLEKYKLKLIGRQNFNINIMKNEFENEIKTIQVYEYDIEEEERK